MLAAAMLSMLAGCGGNTFSVDNQPPPPPPDLSIALSTEPKSPLPLNETTTLAATVTNDSSNAGVDWLLTCPNTDCGHLSTLHTDSGATVTYTPPASFPGNSEKVSIVAFATADHTANQPSAIQITAFGANNLQAGNYVLQVQGSDFNFQPFQFAGVIHLDGNGGITTGQQTVNSLGVSQPTAIKGGSYFLGADGRGIITIVPDDPNIEPEFFSFVLLSRSHALIAIIQPSSSSIGVASGTMDFQAAPPTLSTGGYAFVVNGLDFASGVPTAVGGILNVDSTTNTIPGPGSVVDQNLAGVMTLNKKLTGTLSYPDPNPFGIVTLTLSVPLFTSTTDFEFTGYIVDDSHIRLIESDNGGLGSTAGQAIRQGAGVASLSGTYVFGVPGVDLSNLSPSTLTSVGVFTAQDNGDGTGTLSNGYTDTFLQAFADPNTGEPDGQISTAFDGTYTIASTGRVVLSLKHFSPPPKPAFQTRFFLYLTGDGNPALALTVGGPTNYQLVGAGIAYPQGSPLTFSGNYGFSFSQQNGGQENDGTGQMTVDSTAAFPILGVVDNALGSSQGLRGTLGSDPCSTVVEVPGCIAVNLESKDNDGNGTSAFLTPSLAARVYEIDQDRGFFVETDMLDPNNPGVVSFGYYARRCDVVAGCP